LFVGRCAAPLRYQLRGVYDYGTQDTYGYRQQLRGASKIVTTIGLIQIGPRILIMSFYFISSPRLLYGRCGILANCANGILPLLADSSRGNAFSSLELVLLRAFCHDGKWHVFRILLSLLHISIQHFR